MGWAEDAARTARQVVDESKNPPMPSIEPRHPELVPGAGPSEFLELYTRQMLIDCLRGAAQLQAVLSPPPAIVGPSGQAPARPDPVAVMLVSQIRVLHAQAAMLDLFLTFLSGRPELRPGPAQPPNGDGTA